MPGKKHNIRTLIINANGVSDKWALLENVVEYTDPDVLIISETKLDATVDSTEFLPSGYRGDIRKDRDRKGGGLMIATKSSLTVEGVKIPDTCETVWAKIMDKQNNPIYIGSFYRRPHEYTPSQITELEKVMQHIETITKNNPQSTIILGGDFNALEIDWHTHQVTPNSTMGPLCETLLTFLSDFFLTQCQEDPTREDSVLDLFCTNKPGLVKSTSTIPGISDHDIIAAHCDIRARHTRKAPRKIHMFSKADWTKLKEESKIFCDDFLQRHVDRSVEENYSPLKQHLTDIIKKYIPSRTSSSRFNLPWMNTTLRRMCRKKQRLYNTAKQSQAPNRWAKFKSHKRDTLKELRRARWLYINNILQLSGDSKPFWKYVKSQRQNNIGIIAIKDQGCLHTDSRTKAKLLNKQFESVFTIEDKTNIPRLSIISSYRGHNLNQS